MVSSRIWGRGKVDSAKAPLKAEAPAEPATVVYHGRYVQRLKEQNRRLRQGAADPTLRDRALKRVVSKEW